MLKYHPDIVGQTPQTLEKFREVQEAYKVLSTPELKSEYDLSIARQIKKVTDSSKIAAGEPILIAISSIALHSTGSATANIYQMQRQNFQEHVLPNSSSNWTENLPKYRLERWKRVPLDEKKRSRVRPVWNAFSLGKYFAPYAFSIAVSAGICWYFTRPEVRYGSLFKDIQPYIVKKSSAEH